MMFSVLSEQHARNAVFITAVVRALEFETAIELREVQFGGCRDVPHDHSCGVH